MSGKNKMSDFEKTMLNESKIYYTPKERGAFLDGTEYAKERLIKRDPSDGYMMQASVYREEIEQLQAKLDKAVEALKKYADINNWCDSRDSYQHIVFMDGEDLERVYPQGEKSKKVMGKIARETLAELEADK